MSQKRRHATAPPTRAQYTCDAKMRYASERQAMVRGGTRAENIGMPLYVYRCRECKGWHLTKKRFFCGTEMKRAINPNKEP